ncbi:MAG: Rossmann-like and DUF2520 domain-containing protein [Chitinophagaceae bacterium]
MKVVIIGAGNVASVLGRKIREAGHEIVAVTGRNSSDTVALAEILNTSPIHGFSNIPPEAELYLIAVSDTALYEIPQQLPALKGIVVHTAGSVPMEVLSCTNRPHGIVYPLQSLRKEMAVLPDIPLLIDASDETTAGMLVGFARTLSPLVERANDTQRTQLHLGAVLVSNFTNHLYALAKKYCADNGIEFSLLQPLIEETATRLRQYAPEAVQTGPAARKDHVTIKKHRQLIEQEPALLKVYDALNESILNFE